MIYSNRSLVQGIVINETQTSQAFLNLRSQPYSCTYDTHNSLRDIVMIHS